MPIPATMDKVDREHLHLSRSDIKAKLTSVKAWELPKTPSAFAPEGTWSNEDMEPVTRDKWSWTTLTFCAYWFSDLVNAGQWSAISSYVALGLTWWEGLLAIFVAGVLLGIVIVFNGIIGARLHTPFAVTARSSFGYQLSRFCVVSRMVIAWFWLSINTYQAGTGITQMLTAIWPSYYTLPNHLSKTSGLTSQSLLSFFLFWLLQFPFCLIHPRKLQPLFLMKAIVVPITAIGMMGWSIHAAGSQASEVLRAKSTLSGVAGYLAFCTAVTSAMGSWSTMACNIGDFSRYSKREESSIAQLAIVPFLYTFAALFGAITANMTKVLYPGEVLWQPFDLTNKWQGSHGGRAAAFFCSLAWVLGNMGTNITANSISSANDLCTLFPKYIDIRRGQLFAIIVGTWAFAPWKVLASAGSFISFMGSYSIVLAPIAAILCSDYYLVKRSKIDTPQLYDFSGIYRYTWGVNWRALIALIVSIAPNMPGMINALNSSISIGGAKYVYAIGDVFGMIVAATVHVTLSKLFPDHLSLVSQNVYAHDVLEGRVRYSASGESDLDDKEKHDAYSSVVPV